MSSSDNHGNSKKLLDWAAYALGHHALFVHDWLLRHWTYRRDLARKPSADRQVPSEADELIHAIEVLGDAGVIPADLAAKMQDTATTLTCTAVTFLTQLRSPKPSNGPLDWRSECYPGLANGNTLLRDSGKAFKSIPPLDRWCELGRHLASLRGDPFFDDEDRRHTVELMRRLNGYRFLTDLCAALSNRTGSLPRSLLAQITNPYFGYSDVHRVEQYVRLALREEAAPVPWFELTPEEVRVFETRWRPGEFSHAHLGILWVLCEQPNTPVARSVIWEACRLDCRLDNIRAHVTRLRDHLSPAINDHFQRGPRPEDADQCFIVGLREHLGPYKLKVPPPRVAVLPPRPDFMAPVRAPAAIKGGAAFKSLRRSN